MVEMSLEAYRVDRERYERYLAEALQVYHPEHPMPRLWARRLKATDRMIAMLEEREGLAEPSGGTVVDGG